MANNWYVYANADAGGDGTSPETPFLRLKDAAIRARAGDNIFIGPGVYDEPLQPMFKGLAASGGRINWIGDPMGENLRVPAGDVKIPYFSPYPGHDISENVCWFIDFYSARPSPGGGYSVHLTSGVGAGAGDPENIPFFSKFRAVYFVSCKLSHGAHIIIPFPDQDTSALFDIAVAFRSCLIGYNFQPPFTTFSSIRYFNPTATDGKQHYSGEVYLYGCTVLAAVDLPNTGFIVEAFNNVATTMPSPPFPVSTPVLKMGLTIVNTIFDLTPALPSQPQVHRFMQKGFTPSFAPRIRGNYNIYRHDSTDGAYLSGSYTDLPAWQAASIEETGDMALFVDTADDKLKFKFKTTSEQLGSAIDSGGEASVVHSTALATGTWYHVAATWDRIAEELRLNVDGTETVASLSGSYLHSNVMSSFGGNYYFDRSLDGRIDEFRIWQVARTAAEIAATKDVEIDPNSYPDLIRYYKASEGSGSFAIDATGNYNAPLSGVSYNIDVPSGFTGYSFDFVADSFVRLGSDAYFDYDAILGNSSGSFTIEFWVKLDTLPSTLTHNILLYSRGAQMMDSESLSKTENDDLFDVDGYHLIADSPAIDVGTPLLSNENWAYSGSFDIDGDRRPSSIDEGLLGVYDDEFVDIGADEFLAERDPDTSTPYGFASHLYTYVADGYYPARFLADFDYNADFSPEGTEVCPGVVAPIGGWQDHIRVLCTFNPANNGSWIEIVNTMTGVDLRGQETVIPNSLRGPHFQVMFEIYPHAQHLVKFDLGMDFDEAATTAITEDNLPNINLPPGCEVIAYNYMFKERVGSAIVAKDHSFSIPVWPGTYYLKFQGPAAKLTNQPIYVTIGFSDWYAPFGQTQCAIPRQVDFAEFNNTFMGMVWASWYTNEQFIDEAKRISTELPDSWPKEIYAKKALVRCGRLVKAASWIAGFEIYADPSLNIENHSLTIWNFFNLIVPWSV
jgi:hypothetical protein